MFPRAVGTRRGGLPSPPWDRGSGSPSGGGEEAQSLTEALAGAASWVSLLQKNLHVLSGRSVADDGLHVGERLRRRIGRLLEAEHKGARSVEDGVEAYLVRGRVKFQRTASTEGLSAVVIRVDPQPFA